MRNPRKPPTTPVIPSVYKPPAAFNWNSDAGRQPMDMASIMGAAMPLAGNVQAPTYTTPAPPISGNFWDTVASPDSVLQGLNSLKPIGKGGRGGKGSGIGDPFGLGVNISPFLSGTGKSGSPSMGGAPMRGGGRQSSEMGQDAVGGRPDSRGGKAKSSMPINPMMMQMFMQSGMMDKIGKAFAIGGVDPTKLTSGTIPYY